MTLRPNKLKSNGRHPVMATKARAKKGGCRLLDGRLSINRLSSELSFDANRFKLMITDR
jgi:hypothetical protein